ncbi:ornithine carbamoyltransferase [Ideonella sp.]|uniref:ornithine carbamoyltransferase n=1 Tax=Ideonella sp. TaxID=1929293 RepID=UPI0035B48154
MPFSPSSTLPAALDTMSDADRQHLVASAAALMRQAREGLATHPLQGRNLGLVCEDEHSEAAMRFEQAATALGAHVVRIRPSVAGLDDADALPQTARVLGRLYDAIECQGLPAATVAQIRRHAGVPVYDGLGGLGTAARTVAAMLAPGADSTAPAEGERDGYVLQALLVGSVG